MVPRGSVAALAVVAALALPGCGGGDDGVPSAFGATADRTCRDMTRAVDGLREGLLRTPATSEREGLALALTRYAARIGRGADALAAADPPRADLAFRDAAVRGLRDHATTMRRAAAQTRRDRVARGLRDELRGGSLPRVPPAVLADAPSCRPAAR